MSGSTENNDNLSSKSVKRFAKILFAIVALFAVFACGLATLLLFFGKGLETKIFVLICCLAAFPLIVFFGLIKLQGDVTSKWEKVK